MLKHPALVILMVLCTALVSNVALALEFKSVQVAKAVLYDAPSFSANKTIILHQGYPVEVIVNLGAWIKVRDAQGSLNWIEAKLLSPKRTLLVVQNLDIKQAPNETASKLASVDKEVLLELVAVDSNAAWVQVRHPSGVQGYVQSSLVWGL